MTANPHSREKILHALYEAAELEHNLMCTYLYAAFSLRDGVEEGLSAHEAAAVASWRRTLFSIAVDEMAHLTMVWNITAALGGSPRFGRGNFPLDPGALPARVIVKLAPFNEAVLQHFIYLERPEHSDEPDGEGFAAEFLFTRSTNKIRLTPMGLDYDTVGVFYAKLGLSLEALAAQVGEAAAFCGDPALQIGPTDVGLPLPKPVQCSKTALASFTAIVQQGEGAPVEIQDSHFQKFIAIRAEFSALKKANPAFNPAWPAAVNPVQRTPMRASGRVRIEDEAAIATVDLANAAYGLMLRLIAYAYVVPRPLPEKTLAIDLALGLMRAMTHLAERAARLPAGPASPDCNAGMSFIALRDAAALQPGPAARRFFIERLEELATAAIELAETADKRAMAASRQLIDLAKRAVRGFDMAAATIPVHPFSPSTTAATEVPERTVAGAIETVTGNDLTVFYEGKKCIHARFCVTLAPKTFLANVPGAWIFPDAMATDALVTMLSQCPSGALQYRRNDGGAEEAPPPVNLIAVREAGPYAVRADMRLDGEVLGYRATLCRCGASKNKPFCDSSHHDIHFTETGEPSSRQADMLSVRDGVLAIDPETDGPLQVQGNLEITSGTGRVVARVTQARLCRCGASGDKPFCDGSHARIGFKSD
jgi:CDGSH-type Zn-finger protein/uncharacterized Fe-S cluster protein YjdI